MLLQDCGNCKWKKLVKSGMFLDQRNIREDLFAALFLFCINSYTNSKQQTLLAPNLTNLTS